jgi:uncharacterized RDD family membrane protein YckC
MTQQRSPEPKASPGDPVNDYQDFRPPSAPLADAPECAFQLADRSARLGAKLLDWFTLFGVVLVVGVLAALTLPAVATLLGHGGLRAAGLLELAPGLVVALGPLCLVVWNSVWLHRYGQTIGKRVARIRIVRSDGQRASLGRIFGLRYLPMTLLTMIPALGLLIALADCLLIFRDSRKCLHDQWADTMVIKVP